MGSGRVGSDGNQKCPSMFFLLYEYLDNVYVNLNIYKKIVTNILMGFKIWCQVGGRGQNFQMYRRYMTFYFWV